MRRWVLIVALVAGGFGIGVSEFIVMGLLPEIAADLLPELYTTRRESALAAAGGLASAYGLGVVVGMVVTPIVIRRLPERAALLLCAGSMLLFTALTALAPTFAVALVLRFLAALTHASYIGVGAMATAHILGHNRYGQGSAIVHGGLAAANLLGVPALTAVGQITDWRFVVGGAAVLFAIPVVALLGIATPSGKPVGSTDGAVRRRTAARSPSSRGGLLVLAVSAVLIAASGFALVTYVAPLLQWKQGGGGPGSGLGAAGVMLMFGIGMNVGNFVAGWLADRAAATAFGSAAAVGMVGAGILFVPGTGGVGAAFGLLLVGVMLGGGSPAGQVLFLRELRALPRLASSMPSGTANLGSFTGTIVGGGLLAGVGTAGVAFGALGLVFIGLLCFGAHQFIFQTSIRGAGGQMMW